MFHPFFCDLQGRKINKTNSEILVGWWMSRRTVTRVTSDLPECREPSKNNYKIRKMKKNKNEKIEKIEKIKERKKKEKGSKGYSPRRVTK